MKVSKEAAENQDTNKINPYKLNQYKQSEARLKATVFVDRNEELKVVLGDSYLKNYIQTGRLEKSFAILTDRRVYMKGKCYEKKGLFGLRSTNIDKVIDVQDITGTEYRSRRLPLLKPISFVISILSLYFLFACTVASISTQWEEMIGNVITALVFVITLICWGVFLFVRNSYEFLDISFAGGQIAYDCNLVTRVEVEEFQRQMRLAKDKKVSKQEAAPGHPKILENSDKIKKLKELKELLDSRVITEQEFEKLKSEVMNCN